ncbi:hypothetical protein GCM10023143_20610 [Compostibacter hankyongensis]|uniref:DUF1538 domain-containing protein n=1 Tax=Compostibacter hankyongensis TaxID=1007089 RepID=A0ABP8FUW6_9BACT
MLFNDLKIFVERIGVLFIIGPTFLYPFVLGKVKERYFKAGIYIVIAGIIFIRGVTFLQGSKQKNGAVIESQFLPYKNYLVEIISK